MSRRQVIDGLFTETPAGPRLTGSRCASCKTLYFPKSAVCHNPQCGTSSMQDATFGPRGTLWSLAIQDYPPPPPAKYDEPYVPYAIGVVDLDDGLRVMGRLATVDPRAVEPGVAVELVVEPLYHEADGSEVVTWKFKPL